MLCAGARAPNRSFETSNLVSSNDTEPFFFMRNRTELTFFVSLIKLKEIKITILIPIRLYYFGAKE